MKKNEHTNVTFNKCELFQIKKKNEINKLWKYEKAFYAHTQI